MTARWMVVLGIGSALAMGAAGTVSGATATPDQCRITKTYRISAVTPYRVVDHIVPTEDEAVLRGATLVVDAQPGLTKEWLTAEFEKSIATGECGLGAEPVGVTVQSAGPAFQIQLTAQGEKAAADLLQRVKQMAR